MLDSSEVADSGDLPEVAFDTSAFVASVDRVVTRLGWCVVVVPEGLRKADGSPVFEESAASQRDALNRALPEITAVTGFNVTSYPEATDVDSRASCACSVCMRTRAASNGSPGFSRPITVKYRAR